MREAVEAAEALYDNAVEGTWPGQYAAGSKDIYHAAIHAAYLVADNEYKTVEEVAQALADLNAATAVFEAGKVGLTDKTELREDIQFATTLHDRAVEGTLPGQYAAGSKVVFWSSIQAANAVAENETSTQVEVDQAAADLAEAQNAFQRAKVADPNWFLLREAVEAAEVLYDNAVEGTWPGQYAAGSKDIYHAAIHAAYLVADNEYKTVEEVAQALADLNAATAVFEAGKVPDNYLEIHVVDSISGYDLSGAVFKISKNPEFAEAVFSDPTDSSGKAYVSDLESGVIYFVQESTAPSNHRIDSTVNQITFGGAQHLLISNEPIQQTRSLTITKHIENGTDPSTIFSFNVTGPEAYYKTISINDGDTAILTDLLPGQYTVQELGAEGYFFSRYEIGNINYLTNPVIVELTNSSTEVNIVAVNINTKARLTVSFDSRGGSSIESKTVKYNKTINEPKAPKRMGYTFAGWYKEPWIVPWDFATDTVTSNVTLYAKWLINSYTVTFKSKGGTEVESITALYDTTISIPAEPTRLGYTFIGWYKETSCTNVWDFAIDVVTGNTTLYAEWTINNYTVSFDSQGGSSIESKIVKYNKTINEPKAPKRMGYTFAGWYKESWIVPWDFATDTVTSNVTLYARWLINSYTVTFKSKGGTEVESITALYDTTISIPAEPTRSGYTFIGWYKETSCTNVWDFSIDVVTGNTTLYAKWQRI